MQRIAVVTGSNKGIGFETAKKLAAAGLKTIICARDENRGLAASKDAALFGDVDFRQLDISCDDSRKQFVANFEKDFGRCDILINCAGIAFKAADPTPYSQQARPTFATNYFGTCGFTLAMLPLLRNGISPRIVTIASKSGQLRILKDEEKAKRISSATMSVNQVSEFANEFITAVESGNHTEQGWPDSNLGMSQMCKIAFTSAVARQEAANNIVANCCCPGHCRTDMSSDSGTKSAEEGARTPTWVALLQSKAGMPLRSGAFFSAEMSYSEVQDSEHPSLVKEIPW
jgi:carbonyl reductase 1